MGAACWLAIFVPLGACAPQPATASSASGCHSDTECPGDDVCERGSCVAPAGGSNKASASASPSTWYCAVDRIGHRVCSHSPEQCQEQASSSGSICETSSSAVCLTIQQSSEGGAEEKCGSTLDECLDIQRAYESDQAVSIVHGCKDGPKKAPPLEGGACLVQKDGKTASNGCTYRLLSQCDADRRSRSLEGDCTSVDNFHCYSVSSDGKSESRQCYASSDECNYEWWRSREFHIGSMRSGCDGGDGQGPRPKDAYCQLLASGVVAGCMYPSMMSCYGQRLPSSDWTCVPTNDVSCMVTRASDSTLREHCEPTMNRCLSAQLKEWVAHHPIERGCDGHRSDERPPFPTVEPKHVCLITPQYGPGSEQCFATMKECNFAREMVAKSGIAGSCQIEKVFCGMVLTDSGDVQDDCFVTMRACRQFRGDKPPPANKIVKACAEY